MGKWPWEQDDKKEEEVKLPKELEDRFKKVDALDDKVSNIDKKLASLDSITAFIDEQRTANEQERTRREEAARRAKDKEEELSPEEMAARLVTDPKGVIADATKPQTMAILSIRADQIRRQVFEDRETDFPYYSGDIKTEINKMLAQQSLEFQNNPASVENVYHTVVGRKMKDITEGKIKSRFASATGKTTGSSGADEDKEQKTIKITPEIERAARLTGLKTEDYIELLKNDEEFDYVS
jgi:hypothetical protein